MKHPLMRYHGAKFRLAPWIISFFPDHQTYIEPFGGAAGVLLQKSASSSEVYNDIDGDIVNVFRVLQDIEMADDLYSDILKGWSKYYTTSRISAGRGAGVRKEIVWLNPACREGQAQGSLFD